jgi:hypothetical protein
MMFSKEAFAGSIAAIRRAMEKLETGKKNHVPPTDGIRISKAESENVLPLVTACAEASGPVATSAAELSVSAQKAAVPVPVTEPDDSEGTVTLRPEGEPLTGEPTETPVLLPRV